MLNSQNTHLIETSYDGCLKSENHISAIQENLAKAGVFRWVTNIMNIKDITIPLIIHYYLLEHSEHYTNLSLNHNVRFLPCQHRGVGIMQYVYALNPVCIVLIIPGHSRREVPRQGCGHS